MFVPRTWWARDSIHDATAWPDAPILLLAGILLASSHPTVGPGGAHTALRLSSISLKLSVWEDPVTLKHIREIILVPLFLHAALSATRAHTKEQAPGISISADSLTVDLKAHTAVYRGNVAAHDPARGVTILADRMRFVLDPGMHAVEHARASGTVRLTYHAQRGLADRVEYFPSDARLVLTGHPEVWQNNETISGCRITLLLREDRSQVEGCSGDRVHTVFYPGNTTGAAQLGSG